MRFSPIFTVQSLKSLFELLRSLLLILLMSGPLKIWFCQFARCASLFFLRSAIAPKIKVRSRAKSDWAISKSDWAISKSDVPSSGIHPFMWRVWGNLRGCILVILNDYGTYLYRKHQLQRTYGTYLILHGSRVPTYVKKQSHEIFNIWGFLHQKASSGPNRGSLEHFLFFADFHGLIYLWSILPGVDYTGELIRRKEIFKTWNFKLFGTTYIPLVHIQCVFQRIVPLRAVVDLTWFFNDSPV